jgi:hypothetical protein
MREQDPHWSELAKTRRDVFCTPQPDLIWSILLT